MLGKDGWEDSDGILHYQRLENSLPGNTIGRPAVAPVAGRTYRWISRLDCLYLRIGRAPVTIRSSSSSTGWRSTPRRDVCWYSKANLSIDFVTGLPISTDWKGTSYDSNPGYRRSAENYGYTPFELHLQRKHRSPLQIQGSWWASRRT